MKRTLISCAVLAALVAAPPALASSGGTLLDLQSKNALALPLLPVTVGNVAPPGFTSTAAEAIAAAKATPTMQVLHHRMHPLHLYVFVIQERYWAIEFGYGQRVVAEVDLSRAGRVTHVWTGPLASTTYARGHYAPIFDSPWVVVPFSLLFLVPFVDPRRLLRLRHLDALVVLSLLLSYWLFDHRHLEAAVWLVYPPLLYLFGRLTVIGLRGERVGPAMSHLLSPRVLAGGLLLLVGARIALSLADAKVIDVGYSSVVGAWRLVHGQPLYYYSLAHGDTYGPVAYLAYAPFELLFPWRGRWDYVPAAHAASIFFDLVTIAGLVILGGRLRPGRQGRRLGLALGWAWAACPFTLLGLMEHSNDGLVAMLSVLCLLAFASPAARGAVLGLAAAAKFSPAALLPLFAGYRASRKGLAACVGAFAVVIAGSVLAYLPPGGVREFYDHTIGFQLNRFDVFSPWALHPGLTPVKVALEVGAVLFALAVAYERRPRSFVQLCALAGAVTIAVQVPAVHWFYYYVIWFAPFLTVALLAGPPAADAALETASAEEPEPHPAREPALVGA